MLARASNPYPQDLRVLGSCMLDARTPADNKPRTVARTWPGTVPLSFVDLEHVLALIRQVEKPGDAALRKRGMPSLPMGIVYKNHLIG